MKKVHGQFDNLISKPGFEKVTFSNPGLLIRLSNFVTKSLFMNCFHAANSEFHCLLSEYILPLTVHDLIT